MKSESGITILALVITIAIMAIIGLTVFFTADGIDENIEDDILIEELETVHHIVLQEWNKKLTLGDEYNYINEKTTAVTEANFTNYKNALGIEFEKDFDKYYELKPADLNSIGAKNAKSDYLVCYETGEVANISHYKTSTGEVLYTK